MLEAVVHVVLAVAYVQMHVNTSPIWIWVAVSCYAVLAIVNLVHCRIARRWRRRVGRGSSRNRQ